MSDLYVAVQNSTDLDDATAGYVCKLRRSFRESRKSRRWNISTLLDPVPTDAEIIGAFHSFLKEEVSLEKGDVARLRSLLSAPDVDESIRRDI